MNRLNKFPLDQVLNRNAMDSIVAGTDIHEIIQRGLEQERRRAEREQKGIEIGKGLYLGGRNDLIEYRKGDHTIGYTPNRITYTKSTNCVIL